MNRAFLLGGGLLALILAASAPHLVLAGSNSESVVTIKTRLENAPPGKSVVVFTLDIKPGWHLYANPVRNIDLEAGQVVIKAIGTSADVQYPPGVESYDKEIGKYFAYKKTVEIRATVDRVIDAAHPMDFNVRLQSCDAKVCLVRSDVKVTVK